MGALWRWEEESGFHLQMRHFDIESQGFPIGIDICDRTHLANHRVKSAEMRAFGPELANKLFEAHPSAHTRAVNMCMALLMDFYVLLGVSEWHAQAAADACRRCCVQYRVLSLESIRNGRPLY